MPSHPQATQSYKPENQPANRIIRQARCPQHNTPGKYRAVQPGLLDNKTYWAFACSYLGLKKIHIFLAIPDRTAPTTQEGVSEWIKSQQAQKLQKMEAKRQ